MRAAVRMLAVRVLPLVGLLACDYSRVDVATQGPTAACDDLAGVISARSFACGAGHDGANARYDLFYDRYRCVEWDPVTTPYEELWHCSFAVGQLDCDTVRSHGDDLDRWLAASAACPLLVQRVDGTPLPGGVSGEVEP